ncbi:DUF1214 domain-containing protein [Curvibacter sp. APW13]|uniref:DUF1214 domain-containing protein n=1 Tax=Curvibacter sp. APW13 TaxID=3077236 RepID=UPI0028DFB634|nr:DUF1214 domain-containing protein [Curvibacter sp. APW13]MDT8991690.1 DUF1214 domain-containing protein [Curvibacter sp. APW13]
MSKKHTSSRVRRILVAMVLYCSAVVIGLGSAWWVMKKAPWLNKTLQVGAWKTNLRAGSADADLYTRASIAVNALLALDRAETMYFVASTDDDGRALRSTCSYRISGTPPKARWWSITAYADDMFLFDAPNKHYSLNGSTAQLDAQGNFTFVLSPSAPKGPEFWVPMVGHSGAVLTLRLYNPSPEMQANPASLSPVRIERQGDCA